MKRRLTRAYDSMTMPDGCSNTIEQKLSEQLKQRKNGKYTQIKSPEPVRSHGWALGIAAVCLVLMLSVGGSMLLFAVSDTMMVQPEETKHATAEQQYIATEAAEDHYALVTDIPAVQVEAFAEVVRYNMLEKNWEALKDRIHFPLTVQDEEIQDWQGFLDWVNGYSLYSSSWKKLEEETCTAMFCNWQGIRMADGFLWINDVDGKLKVTAIQLEEQEEPVETDVPAVFADILKEKKAFFCERTTDDITITEYCELRSKETGKAVAVSGFTVVDMDRDGIKELILKFSIEDDSREDYLVLRWQEYEGSDKSFVYGYMEGLQMMTDLRKDGSFWWREAGPGQGESRLVLDPENGNALVVSGFSVQGESPSVLWHAWPCVRPEVILDYYKYAGTGQNLFPGNHWYIFEGIANGSMENSWERWQGQMTRWGMICLEENGAVSVYDPDAPGRQLFGTLDEEGRFISIGFYISNEYGEREVEVRNLLSEEHQYIAGSHLKELDAHGREVDRLELLLEYLS